MKDIKIKWGNGTFIKRQREKCNMTWEKVKLEYSNWNEDYNLTMFIKKQHIKFF